MSQRLILATALLCIMLAGPFASNALGSSPAPHWSIVSQSEPSHLKAGDISDALRLIVRNDGGAPTEHGSSVVLSDTLPVDTSGPTPISVKATGVVARGEAANGSGAPAYSMSCPSGEVTGTVTCTYEEGGERGPILPGTTVVITITVSIPEGVTRLSENVATVSGGGAPSASITEAPRLSADPVPFGLSYLSPDVVDASGSPDTQAGSHPFELTANLAYEIAGRETPTEANGKTEFPLSNFSPKDLEVALPPGLIGNTNAVPQCSQQAFQLNEGLECPLASQVGTVKPLFYGKFRSAFYPVYNIAPPPGQPAELGVAITNVGHVPIFFHVRSDGDYGLTMKLNSLPETGPLQGAIITLWGVPADASHDLEREGTIGQGSQQQGEMCKPLAEVNQGVERQVRCPSGVPAHPFLTMPDQCSGISQRLEVGTDSWQNPAASLPLTSLAQSPLFPGMAGPTGCERVPFTPTISVAPALAEANAPSGYTVDVHVPQNEDPSGLATAELQRATIALPQGVVLSPSAANGLQACPEDGFALHSLAPAACSPASQIGTVTIDTPLLRSPLEGQLFLGKPPCSPCGPVDAQEGRLLPIMLQAEGSGVTVKLRGALSVDQATGRLTARFEEIPQLPFTDVKLTLNGGPRAPLANPGVCGSALAATSQLVPYSGQAPAEPAGVPFTLTGCPLPRFAPAFTAGTTNNRTGAGSAANAFTMTFSRHDGDQAFRSVTVRLPAGVTAALAKVTPCVEPYVRAQQCGPQNEIGSTTVAIGPGSEPYPVTGRVYLTSAYGAGPFGLSIVVPLLAGPLNLGTVNVRAAIEVDPATAALTIKSDPWPTSIDGIPLQIKTVTVAIDRPGLIVNPTSCARISVAAMLVSAQGATAAVSSPYQAAGCASLHFAPKLTVLTHASTSKALGVYLHARVVATPRQANIGKLRVELPRQFSTRGATLQKACPPNVAVETCTTAVGKAIVTTPLLRNSLSGPVYVVSQGSSALPQLTMLLRGEGITLTLSGQVSIAHGIVAVAFRSLPDLPISSFDLILPAGGRSLVVPTRPLSVRAMCRERIAMPAQIAGQNGAALNPTVSVAVSGCARHWHGRRR